MAETNSRFSACILRGRRFAPARFCAPMAGYTHSAFRRMLGELGGCGGIWTEMLAARQILSENFAQSPWLRRRACEGDPIYQLMVRAGDPFERILARLQQHGVTAIDLNLACHAPSIRSCESGSALFDDLDALGRVLDEVRRHWPGLLSVKVRLGRRREDWELRFAERMRLFANVGVDAVVVHPRFFEDKFKRRARLELIPWVAALAPLPTIANGDLEGPAHAHAWERQLAPACAIMVGRMAIVQPWLFAGWDLPQAVDVAEIWLRLFDYICEDFPPATALRRIRMFTKYYAANFLFGHSFRVSIGNAPSLEEARLRGEAFLRRSPTRLARPFVMGL